MINRASEGTCRQCGRRILWVRMKSGKNMPVDKLLEECHRIFDDKSGRNEMLAQKASELFEEE